MMISSPFPREMPTKPYSAVKLVVPLIHIRNGWAWARLSLVIERGKGSRAF